MDAEQLAELVSEHSRVRFAPFFSKEDGDWHIVGWPDRALYLRVPRVGIRAMELLQEGLTVEEVTRRLDVEEGTFANVTGFVRGMARRGLVTTVDGGSLEELEGARPSGGIVLLGRLEPGHVRWLFGRPALALYVLLALASGAMLWRHPWLVPTSGDWLFLPWYGVNMLGVLLTNVLLIFVHELGHCAAARAFGLDARLGVSRRLYEPVAVTRLGNVWRLTRGQRAVVHSAGIAVNACLFFAALSLVVWQPSWLPHVAGAWLRAVLVSLWVSTGWQFALYMRTDVYYLVADALRARNLMDDARAFIRHTLATALPWVAPPARPWALRGREARVVRGYAAVYVLGVGVASFFFLAYNLPFLARSVLGAAGVALAGRSSGLRLLDSALIVVVLGAHYGTLVVVWLREKDVAGALARRRPLARRPA